MLNNIKNKVKNFHLIYIFEKKIFFLKKSVTVKILKIVILLMSRRLGVKNKK